MAKLKVKKEEPRYNTQKQYEGEFKRNYAKMLNSMNKEIIHILSNGIK